MVLLKAILLALVLMLAWQIGYGRWAGNGNGHYASFGIATAIVALAIYIMFRR